MCELELDIMCLPFKWITKRVFRGVVGENWGRPNTRQAAAFCISRHRGSSKDGVAVTQSRFRFEHAIPIMRSQFSPAVLVLSGHLRLQEVACQPLLTSKLQQDTTTSEHQGQVKVCIRKKVSFWIQYIGDYIFKKITEYNRHSGLQRKSLVSNCPPFRTWAGNITAGPSHPGHSLFQLLLSGRRYGALYAKTTRLKNIFFLQAITMMNT